MKTLIKKAATLLLFIAILCHAQLFASESLQSAFYIENSLDKTLEKEFCQKSDLNKRKTIDYWLQKAGFAPNTISIPHHNFPEGEHRLFFDPKEDLRAEAAYKLGIFYGSGQCMKSDPQKAKYYLKKAAPKAEARFAYAMILLRERGKLSDIYRLFLEAGDLGVGEAYYNAALLLYKKDSEKYGKKIIALLKKSAKNGYARADNDLGVFMMSEKGARIFLKPSDQYNKNKVTEYFSSAETHIEKAAEKNNKYALYNYAMLLSKGGCENSENVKGLLETSMNQDFTPASALYQKLAAQNCFTPTDTRSYVQKASLLLNHEITSLNNKEKFGFRLNPD